VPAWGQVRVGDVQDPQWPGSSGEHGNVEAPKREPVALDDRRVTEHASTDRRSRPEESLSSHLHMVPRAPTCIRHGRYPIDASEVTALGRQ
jgi:hypothetical protein